MDDAPEERSAMVATAPGVVVAAAISASAHIATAVSRSPYYEVNGLEPARSIGNLLKRCGAQMTQLAERRFEAQELSFTQWLVLVQLRFQSLVSMTQLSEELEYDAGALSRVVDALERGGLLSRERSRRDRRFVELALTPAGRVCMEAGLHTVAGLLNEVVQPFSQSEIDHLISLLQRTLNRLQFLTHENTHRPESASTALASQAQGPGGDKSTYRSAT
jgi:DNA-binding MarR family transcriptional regulator